MQATGEAENYCVRHIEICWHLSLTWKQVKWLFLTKHT